jgi:hypothetical protein
MFLLSDFWWRLCGIKFGSHQKNRFLFRSAFYPRKSDISSTPTERLSSRRVEKYGFLPSVKGWSASENASRYERRGNQLYSPLFSTYSNGRATQFWGFRACLESFLWTEWRSSLRSMCALGSSLWWIGRSFVNTEGNNHSFYFIPPSAPYNLLI